MNDQLIPINRPSGIFYAVQLENTGKIEFEPLEENKSKIKIRWDDIPLADYNNLNDLNIEVAKKYPNQSSDDIKNTAKSISSFISMKKNDKVMGFKDHYLEKIGYVEDRALLTTKELEIEVHWVDQNMNIDLRSLDIFKRNAEIKKITKSQLKKIEKSISEEFLLAVYNRLPSTDLFSEYQEYDDYRIVEPEINFLKSNPVLLERKVDQGGIIRLFYGTNRKNMNGSETPKYSKESGELKLGFCDIQIPKGHVEGELERPRRIIIWELPENEKAHIVVKDIREYNAPDFQQEFRAKLSESSSKDVLLFIHGFNNTFEEAARRCAQLSWDLPFDGVSGFYSWPSAGRILSYLEDESSCRSSVSHFESFLHQIIKMPEVQKLHIIAHSMGSLLLSLSLNQLRGNITLIKSIEEKLHQIILGAPDIDQDEFRQSILPEFKNFGSRRTIYASDKDFALNSSSMLRKKRPRLGLVKDVIFLDSELDTVEASNVGVADLHGYIFESKSILGDIYYLLSQNLSPANRRLRQVKMGDLFYWLFPK